MEHENTLITFPFVTMLGAIYSITRSHRATYITKNYMQNVQLISGRSFVVSQNTYPYSIRCWKQQYIFFCDIQAGVATVGFKHPNLDSPNVSISKFPAHCIHISGQTATQTAFFNFPKGLLPRTREGRHRGNIRKHRARRKVCFNLKSRSRRNRVVSRLHL